MHMYYVKKYQNSSIPLHCVCPHPIREETHIALIAVINHCNDLVENDE